MMNLFTKRKAEKKKLLDAELKAVKEGYFPDDPVKHAEVNGYLNQLKSITECLDIYPNITDLGKSLYMEIELALSLIEICNMYHNAKHTIPRPLLIVLIDQMRRVNGKFKSWKHRSLNDTNTAHHDWKVYEKYFALYVSMIAWKELFPINNDPFAEV